MEESQEKASRYPKLTIPVMRVMKVAGLAALFAVLLLSGASAWLAGAVRGWTASFYLQVVLYMLIQEPFLVLVYGSLDLYQELRVKHRLGLSNMTFRRWLKTRLLAESLSVPFGVPLILALYFLLRHFPDTWWLFMAGAFVAVMLGLTRITPNVILPLFYQCRPLADPDLRQRLLAFADRCGAPAKEVHVIDLSQDTKVANAACIGLGKSCRIILGDTLLANYTPAEVEAVFAHELGHYHLHHTLKTAAYVTANVLVVFYLASLLYDRAIGWFGFSHVSDVGAFPLLALLILLIFLIVLPLDNWYMRRLEKQADDFALDHIADKQAYDALMAKLAREDSDDPAPGLLKVMYFYDHPPTYQRTSDTR